MTEDFKKSLKFVFKWENVYNKKGEVIATNDPDDPGGVTKYGIDQRSNPGVDVANLTEQQAAELYWKEWLDCRAGELPFPLSMAYFDGVVNTGPSQGTKFLQRAVGAKDDGVLGPKTLASAKDACEKRGVESVARAVCSARDRFYIYLVEQKPKFSKFKTGWLRRVSDLSKEVSKK
jgi:lysozyme family protein